MCFYGCLNKRSHFNDLVCLLPWPNAIISIFTIGEGGPKPKTIHYPVRKREDKAVIKLKMRVYLLLVEYFHGIEIFGSLVLNEHHSSERPSTKGSNSIEVVESGIILRERERGEEIDINIRETAKSINNHERRLQGNLTSIRNVYTRWISGAEELVI